MQSQPFETGHAAALAALREVQGLGPPGLGVDVDTPLGGPRPASFRVTLTMPPGLDESQHQKLHVIATKCPVHRTLSDAVPVEVV